MLKKGKAYRWVISIAVIIALFIIGGFIFLMGNHYISIRGQHLNKYCYSSGGDMTGGYYRETVKRCDDAQALISIEKAEWYSQDPEIKEYLVDESIMDELEGIVRKYRMNFWNRKKFTNQLILDGGSEGYSFSFDEGYISFSSQIYPLRYGKKLHKFDEIIKKYVGNAKELPGLVNTKRNSDENYFLPEEELELYVCFISGNRLGIRVLNGTEEEIEIPNSYKLINTDTDELIAENDFYYGTVYPKTRDEIDISLEERLDAGNYKIALGEIEIPFEIR